MRRSRRSVLFLLLAAALMVSLTAGCAAKRAEQAIMIAPAQPAPAVEGRAGATSSAYGGGESPSFAADAVSVTERMIIQTVDMVIVVEDTDAALDLIRTLVVDEKGFIAESRRWLTNEQPYAQVTFRVPASALERAIDALHKMALRIESENRRGEDVTEEYVDLDARLRNLEATEKELLALMTEVRENRGKAEDILAIYREITSVRAQIESLKGRQQYLERMTAMATINLEIRPKEAPRAVVTKAKWNPLVTLTKALRGFVEVMQVLADIAIYLLIFSPIVIVPAVILWLIIRWSKRQSARKKGKGAPPQSQ